MKFPLLLTILFFLAAQCIFSSCSTPKNPEFKEIKNIRINKLGFSTGKLSMDVMMYNPNNFSIELGGSELDIYLENAFLGHTKQDTQIKVPKKSNFTVPVSVEIDMKNLLKNSLHLLGNKEMEVSAKGTVRIGKAGIFKTFDVDYSGRHKIPKPDIF